MCCMYTVYSGMQEWVIQIPLHADSWSSCTSQCEAQGQVLNPLWTVVNKLVHHLYTLVHFPACTLLGNYKVTKLWNSWKLAILELWYGHVADKLIITDLVPTDATTPLKCDKCISSLWVKSCIETNPSLLTLDSCQMHKTLHMYVHMNVKCRAA